MVLKRVDASYKNGEMGEETKEWEQMWNAKGCRTQKEGSCSWKRILRQEINGFLIFEDGESVPLNTFSTIHKASTVIVFGGVPKAKARLVFLLVRTFWNNIAICLGVF